MRRKRVAILLGLIYLFTSILPVQMVFGKEVVITRSILSEKPPQKTTDGQIEVDLSRLVDLIKEAEVLVNTVIEGTTPGCYDVLDITKFELSITLAKQALEDTKTQQDIDKAIVELQKAIEIFKDSVIVDKEKLEEGDTNADGTINIADLALGAYYFRVQEGDTNWEQAKYTDVNGDKDINIVDLSILAKKILDK